MVRTMKSFTNPWPFQNGGDGYSNLTSMAENNRMRVLGLIARRKYLSQRQLADATGMQRSTVSYIVRDLKELGIIREGVAIRADRVGPKETELEIVPNFAWSIGLQLDRAVHRLCVVNAMGHILTQETFPPGLSLSEVISALPRRVNDIAQRLSLPMDRLSGVGVSVAGVVDSEGGKVLVSRNLNLQSMALREELEAVMKCPVWVDRNVVCGAYAEHFMGAAQDRNSFLYFLLKTDEGRPQIFGLAMVIGEQIFRGCNSAAGEVDHTFLAKLFQKPTNWDDANSMDEFYRSCAEGLAGIVNLLDMSCMVLCSDDEQLTEERFQFLNDEVNADLVPVPGRRFELLRSGSGMDGMMIGAALLALHWSLATKLTEGRRSEAKSKTTAAV